MERRIENKLIWMNVDPWDSYVWLAEYICKLEDENSKLEDENSKLKSDMEKIFIKINDIIDNTAKPHKLQ